MTTLSTGPLSVSPYAANGVYTPFILYGELKQSSTLTFGGVTRREKVYALEKVGNLIETVLRAEEIDIAYPIKFVPFFGNEPAKIVINGNWGDGSVTEVTNGSKPPKKIAENVERINTGVVEDGQGSFNAADLKPVFEVDDLANEIKSWFESKIGSYIEVMSLDVHGVMYGRRGRHFA